MSNEASREAFEAWCAASNQKYHPTDDGLSNRQDWQTWQAGRKALEAEQAQAVEPVKWWPFVETPGHFTARLEKAIATNINLLAAVRNVLIEVPPTLTHLAPPPVAERPLSTERAELVAWLHEKYHEKSCGEIGLKQAADMLEADAQNGNGYAILYAGLADAMGYTSGKDGMEYSPEEWAESLLKDASAFRHKAQQVAVPSPVEEDSEYAALKADYYALLQATARAGFTLLKSQHGYELRKLGPANTAGGWLDATPPQGDKT